MVGKASLTAGLGQIDDELNLFAAAEKHREICRPVS